MKVRLNISWIWAFLMVTSVSASSSEIAFAAVTPNDPSYQYLTFLFGTVSPDLTCYNQACSVLTPQLFAILNQGLLAVASLVMTYVLLISIASSAHEGEFMGKKGSSLWVPVRISAGIGFLIPTSTGYSALQGFLMKMILIGVSIGNSLYSTVGNYVTVNDRSFAKEFSGSAGSAMLLTDLISLSNNIFNHELCYACYTLEQPFTQDLADLGLLPTNTMNNGPAPLNCNSKQTSFMGYEYTVDQATFNTGCSFTPPTEDLCGSWRYYYASNDPDIEGTQAALEGLTLNLRNAANILATQWYSMPAGQTENFYMSDASEVTSEKNLIQQTVLSGLTSFISSKSQAKADETTSVFEGYWINFPLEFYNWIGKGTSSIGSLGSVKDEMGDAMDEGINDGSEKYKNLKAKLKTYNFFDTGEIFEASGTNTNAMKIKRPDGLMGPSLAMYTVMQDMLIGDSEPLISLAIFGQFLLKLSIASIVTSILIGMAMVTASAVCSSFVPNWSYGVTTAIVSFFATLFLAFGFLIPMGVVLGVYLPLIPGMTYCSGVVIWFLMVIETMIAGPIIALGLMSPGQESLGKAQPALLMTLNVIIRPGLMVIGMVLGAKMFNLFSVYFTNIMMSGFAFIAKKAGFNGFFEVIFIMFWFFYAFSIVGVAQRCYALIYILPDKAINWVGGQGGSSREIQEDLGAMRQAAEKGGDSMKTQTETFSSGVQRVNESVIAAQEQAQKKNG